MGDIIYGIDNVVLVLCMMIIGAIILAIIYYSNQRSSAMANHQMPQPSQRVNTEQYH